MSNYKEIHLNDINWKEKLINLTNYEENFVFPIKYNGKFTNLILTPTLIISGFNEKKETIVKNTLSFISENFNSIYENMLKTLVKTFKNWDIYDNDNKEDYYVKTEEDLDKMRYDGNFIDTIIINCNELENEFAYYSFKFQFNYCRFGYDDGAEVVMYKDKVIFWADGNSMEYIYTFRDILEANNSI
ncbi:hypothetical protein HBE96_12945 [Clostridium sp. P21]|uniref:DUF2262 domain-containing protein n=1 Tax=Clostridium muellerianum TaxID=2716538 RepID=A0A7Y0EJI6_9CLOT|nr:hypothetical protein [Clostridium muellerianum]NMM63565.1 hypothetical protein [Clostridium muellerianum]